MGVRSVTTMRTPCGQSRDTSALLTAGIDSTRVRIPPRFSFARGVFIGTSAARSTRVSVSVGLPVTVTARTVT